MPFKLPKFVWKSSEASPVESTELADRAATKAAEAELAAHLEIMQRREMNVEQQLMDQLMSVTSAKAGVTVNPRTALGVPTVFACVRRITDTMVTLPLHLKRMRNGFAEEVPANPLHNLVRHEPNPWMSAADFMDAVIGHLALRKNSYAIIHFDKVDRPAELIPVEDPRKVSSDLMKNGTRVYLIEGYGRAFAANEVLHFRSDTNNGMSGRDMVKTQADAIGLAIALVDNASEFFKNGSRPSVVFKHPGRIKDDTYDRLKQDLQDKYALPGNRYRSMLLEEGLSLEVMRHKNNESQMVESRKEQAYEVARVFGVPPHKVGIMDKSSFNNIESQNREYAVDTILPIVTRVEQELNLKLLTPRQRVQGFHFRFNMDGLLRPHTKDRYEAHKIAIEAGFKNKDEVRRLEGLPPIPDGLGEIFVESQNVKPVGSDPEGEKEPEEEEVDEDS